MHASGNIGNARLAGLEKDLNMAGDQYNVALTIFFVSYIVFEVPANMALKYLSPRVWSKYIIETSLSFTTDQPSSQHRHRVGHRDDSHGCCPQLRRSSGRPFLPWRPRVRHLSGSCLLHYYVVY